jgi:hypothetical protein
MRVSEGGVRGGEMRIPEGSKPELRGVRGVKGVRGVEKRILEVSEPEAVNAGAGGAGAGGAGAGGAGAGVVEVVEE